jgi:hypothetical protein
MSNFHEIYLASVNVNSEINYLINKTFIRREGIKKAAICRGFISLTLQQIALIKLSEIDLIAPIFRSGIQKFKERGFSRN